MSGNPTVGQGTAIVRLHARLSMMTDRLQNRIESLRMGVKAGGTITAYADSVDRTLTPLMDVLNAALDMAKHLNTLCTMPGYTNLPHARVPDQFAESVGAFVCFLTDAAEGYINKTQDADEHSDSAAASLYRPTPEQEEAMHAVFGPVILDPKTIALQTLMQVMSLQPRGDSLGSYDQEDETGGVAGETGGVDDGAQEPGKRCRP